MASKGETVVIGYNVADIEFVKKVAGESCGNQFNTFQFGLETLLNLVTS